MIRRPPRSTHCISSAASDVYKRQVPPYYCVPPAAGSRARHPGRGGPRPGCDRTVDLEAGRVPRRKAALRLASNDHRTTRRRHPSPSGSPRRADPFNRGPDPELGLPTSGSLHRFGPDELAQLRGVDQDPDPAGSLVAGQLSGRNPAPDRPLIDVCSNRGLLDREVWHRWRVEDGSGRFRTFPGGRE